VQIGSINASMFALVADGKNGLRVLQMISPENVPGHMGFSPAPNPKLIATFPTETPAVAVSRGLDRDRVVDETGNQTVVFGRRGSRPFNLHEMTKFYRRGNDVYRVEDVKMDGDKLLTKSKVELIPTSKYEPVEERTDRLSSSGRARLERRGK
jgi:hypothetical protein